MGNFKRPSSEFYNSKEICNKGLNNALGKLIFNQYRKNFISGRQYVSLNVLRTHLKKLEHLERFNQPQRKAKNSKALHAILPDHNLKNKRRN